MQVYVVFPEVMKHDCVCVCVCVCECVCVRACVCACTEFGRFLNQQVGGSWFSTDRGNSSECESFLPVLISWTKDSIKGFPESVAKN